MIPPNTAVHGSVMRGVLQHLPTMSTRIVDDTRHEKVLAYMRLFLASPDALRQLQEWDALTTLSQSLASTDARVTSVAMRFLADMVAHADGGRVWAQVFAEHPEVVAWVARAADSAEALERLASVYFLRRAAEHRCRQDTHLEGLLELVDVGRLVVRRTLDSSHYVAHEAAHLLAALCWHGDGRGDGDGRVEDAWVQVACGMRVPTARLGVARVLLAHTRVEVRRHVARGLVLGDGLFDGDRAVRDRALDVLEAMVRVTGDVAGALGVLQKTGGSGRDVLRALAAVVRAAPGHATCREIAGMCAAALEQSVEGGELAFAAAPGVRVAGRRLGVEVARVVDAYGGGGAWGASVADALARVLADGRVLRGQAHQPLLRAVLSAARRMMAHAATGSPDCSSLLAAVGGLVGDFGVHSGALRIALDAVAGALANAVADAEFVGRVVGGVRGRLADVEWEGRDLAVEFVATCVRSVGWPAARAVAEPLVGDLRGAMADPDEYVRASAASALAAIIEARLADGLPGVSVDPRELACLLADSEAVVRRAAADLLCALVHDGPSRLLRDLACVRAVVDAGLLRRLARDEDFEVRVRCARVVSAVVWLMHFSQETAGEATSETASEVEAAAPDGLGLEKLNADTLLVEMCADSSRYVRRVCFDSLVAMRQAIGEQKDEQNCEAGEETDGVEEADGQGKRQRTRGARDGRVAFVRRLRVVDYVALERSLDLEHLYHEALDAPVERDLMDEDDEANCGNNILECY
ncbi:hypothetical protein LPJ53_002884 [Coemansia erecta]|uniref:ARM repeat-containing protein n=1 Tax=Coemansia erecta TaxID=147472 RepID=A0A9W8CSJ7_9FUNG|nr:hypothetical protein LPJ53_002884 [Coemansia erecta]